MYENTQRGKYQLIDIVDNSQNGIDVSGLDTLDYWNMGLLTLGKHSPHRAENA